MAKRRRLNVDPQGINPEGAPPAPASVPRGPLGAPPIASVAGDASASAALAEVADVLETARSEGRMILELPLAAVDAGYLVRDRLPAGADEAMDSLMASLRARGQQTPIEVAPLGDGRYGLISGWRRLAALTALAEETEEPQFDHVLAILRQPEAASDAYIAMVEENEIRAGLSYYERARIAVQAADAGVFPTEKKALQGLFASASFPRRSKIKSFIPIVRQLDAALRFPAAIGERLGLTLSKRLEADAGLAGRIAAALKANPPESAAAEQAVLSRLSRSTPPAPKPARSETSGRAVFLRVDRGSVTLTGPDVDDAFIQRLRAWLET